MRVLQKRVKITGRRYRMGDGRLKTGSGGREALTVTRLTEVMKKRVLLGSYSLRNCFTNCLDVRGLSKGELVGG